MAIMHKLFHKIRAAKFKLNWPLKGDSSRKLKKIKRQLDRKRIELVNSKIEIEKAIYSANPDNKENQYVPPFHLWIQFPDIEGLNLEEALDRYIAKYNLLQPSEIGEPANISKISARLKILRESKNKFNPEISEEINKYLFHLQNSLVIHRMQWEVHKKGDSHKKNINDFDKNT